MWKWIVCVTQLLTDNHPDYTNEYTPLVRFIKDFLRRDWHITLIHVYRESNFAADFRANYALSLPLGLHFLPCPPIGAVSLLTHDMYEVIYPCLIPI